MTPALKFMTRFLQVSNAYLKFIKGPSVEMLLEYVKDMPKVGTSFQLDLSSLLSALFFTWIIELLFPVSMMRYIDVTFCKYSRRFVEHVNSQYQLSLQIDSFFLVGYLDISGV